MKTHTVKKTKAFTLVEIMIVVVIIGLLAAMAIPAFKKVTQATQDKTVLNNLRQIQSAADRYFLEKGESTVDLTQLVTDGYLKVTPQPVADEVYPPTILAAATTPLESMVNGRLIQFKN